MGEYRKCRRAKSGKVIGLIIVLLLGIGIAKVNATTPPIHSPIFSFSLSALRGAAPITILAQPLVNGETGEFKWDWDGDGEIDSSSYYRTQHQYTKLGSFAVTAWLYSENGHVYEANEPVHISITNSFTGPTGTPLDSNNHDWSTSENLPLGETIYRHLDANSHHFYTINIGSRGNYLIKTWALDSSSQNAGTVLTLYSEVGFVIVSSGSSTGGKFGYFAVPLEAGTYYIKVINYSSAINYGLSCTTDTGEIPTNPEETGDELVHPDATRISCGSTQTATVTTTGEWYQFTLNNDVQVTISTTKDDTSLVRGVSITLYDASDNPIATDGGATFGTISHSLAKGTYYIFAKAENFTIGTYTITLTCATGSATADNENNAGDNSLSLPTTPTTEEVPLPDTGPSPAYPLALHIAGGMYTLILGTGRYSSPVDIYVVSLLPSGELWVFKRYTNEAGLTAQLEPYVANSKEPTDGTTDVLIKIPSTLFPRGTTYFYLLVVEAGTDFSNIDWEEDGYILQYFSVVH